MYTGNYFIKEYKYSTRDHGEQIGSVLKTWDGDNPYYFFKEISKTMYNYFMQRHHDRITTIVWNGLLYEYVNPQDVLRGVFVFRNAHGNEHNIDLRGYLSAKTFVKRKGA